jgi:hypothetical protein
MAASASPMSTPSVSRELSRIDLHVRHAKEFMQMGLAYSEDLLGELRQIKQIAEKAIVKATEDVKRSEEVEPAPRQTFQFDDIEDPLDLSVPLDGRTASG